MTNIATKVVNGQRYFITKDGALCTTCCTACSFYVRFFYTGTWPTSSEDHVCNRAVWDAYVNNLRWPLSGNCEIGTGRYLGPVNLNNFPGGGSRTSDWFRIYPTDINTTTLKYNFFLDCKNWNPFSGYYDCHTDITEIEFRTLEGVLIGYAGRESTDCWSIDAEDICNPAP